MSLNRQQSEQTDSSVGHRGGILGGNLSAQQEVPKYPLKPSEMRGYLAEDFGWRNEVYKLLWIEPTTAAEANDFLWCGSNFRGVEVCADDITHSRAIPVTCHKRYCPQCARREAARLVANHTPQIKAIVDECPNKNFRLRRIELTTAIDVYDPDIDAKIDAAIDAVNRTFDYFCGSKLTESQRHRWSERSHKAYTGEALMFTIEFGEGGRKLHFHCLFFGRYIGKYDLSRVWFAMSGYSITWVQHVAKTEAGIREALKYVSKDIKPKTDPRTGEILATLPDPRLIARIAEVLKGRRRVFCRGAFRGLEDDISEPGEQLGEIICKSCGGSAELVNIDFWADHLYPKYLAALRRQLDLKPGNKSATDIESDGDSPGSGSDPPPKNTSQVPVLNLNQYIADFNEGKTK